MRADDDEIGAPLRRLLQQFVIDRRPPAPPRSSLRRQIDPGENRVELVLRPLLLLFVEIRRHIFHERRRNDRLDVDQPQFAAARLGEFERLRSPFGAEAGSARSTARTIRLYMASLLRDLSPRS